MNTPLNHVSFDRLASLLRHWAWADEALATLDRDLDGSLTADDENQDANPPFGAYYHWCALLCSLSEAALEGRLLSTSELDPLRLDIEATLPRLRECRQMLVVIPASIDPRDLAVDPLGDPEALRRLRRLHQAFGDAIRQERMLRQVDSLDH